MLPGKKYKPEDFLRIAWRRKWVMLLPFAIITTAVAVYSSRLPNLYRSDTLILVVPQQVPENFVRSTVTMDLNDRLRALSQEILSRTRLERIIVDLNLYPERRAAGIMEDVVEGMRGDISIAIAKRGRRGSDSASFTLSYIYTDPQIAMRVTDQLATLFIEANLQERSTLAQATNDFLEAQVGDQRARLAEQERRLEEYRKRHGLELPAQAQSNLQQLAHAQQQIQTLQDSLNKDADRRLVIEKTMADLAAQVVEAPPLPVSSDASRNRPRSGVEELEQARVSLQALQLRLKPEHPDVIKLQSVVAALEKKAEAESLQAPVTPGAPARPGSPAEAQRRTRLNQLQTELESLDRQVALKRQEGARLRTLMATYQARVDAVPARESEMTALMRDYETVKESYRALLRKLEDSRVATSLESRQIGEQFRIIDRPRLPERPISPDRQRMNLMGALAGLSLGVVIVGLLEYRDTSFRSEEDIITILSLPVLALLPPIVTTRERRLRRKRRLVYASSGGLTLAIVLFAVAWKLNLLKDWMQ